MDQYNSHITSLTVFISSVPLFIFFFLLFFGRKLDKYRGVISTGLMFVLTSLAVYVFTQILEHGTARATVNWFQLGNYDFTFDIKIDVLSSLLIFIVVFISFLVHLFSIEYLRGDRDFEKYFAYLGLFTFSMLWILMTNNLLIIFIFWELVGFCSYLLIGFWYRKESALFANKKAFIVNKIGDVGFLLGLLIIWSLFGTFDLDKLYVLFPTLIADIPNSLCVLCGIGLFFGTISKSAQFPLHVWLPNAMEGPTPVSALIHAATMVAAGIYLLARVFVFLDPVVLDVVVVIGSITLLIGAFSALVQTDIKLVLAYSTISQLGYMVLGMGVKAYDAALFHLVTHAFFKAGLFLSAGAIIHSMYVVKNKLNSNGNKVDFDPQDMRIMGGLRRAHPVTFLTYLIASFALMGLPFFSGFLSKDGILLATWAWANERGGISMLVPLAAFSGAGLTAFYMARQLILVFWGEFRLTKLKGAADAGVYLENSPWPMRIPNIVLATLSIWLFFSFNPLSLNASWFLGMLTSFAVNNGVTLTHIPHEIHLPVTIVSTCFVLTGISIAGYKYFIAKKSFVFLEKGSKESTLRLILLNNFYFNEFNNSVIVRLTMLIATISAFVDLYVINKIVDFVAFFNRQLSKGVAWLDEKIVNKSVEYFSALNVIFAHLLAWLDKFFVDGVVNGVSWSTGRIGLGFRQIQTGNLQTYVAAAIIGSLTVLGIILLSI